MNERQPESPNRPPSPQGAEARRSDRVSRRISVAYSFEPAALLSHKLIYFRFGTLLNISEHGLCLQSGDPFSVSQVVSLYLKITDETNGINALGRVVWAETGSDGETRVGIRLVGSLPSGWRRFIGEA